MTKCTSRVIRGFSSHLNVTAMHAVYNLVQEEVNTFLLSHYLDVLEACKFTRLSSDNMLLPQTQNY
jgi:hypothetical protein